MAHKKAGGSTRLGRDSNPQYLGVKVGDGQTIKAGSIIIRQRGTRIHPGKKVKKGKDDTLFAAIAGKVKFTQKKRRRFDGSLKMTKYANIIPGAVKKTLKKLEYEFDDLVLVSHFSVATGYATYFMQKEFGDLRGISNVPKGKAVLIDIINKNYKIIP